MMKLRLLRYFIIVAEELSFGKAAARLHVEPSPLSRAIRELEHDVGVKLLYSSRGKVRLTWSGEAFLQDARPILALHEDAKNYIRKMEAGSQCRIRIGIADSPAQPRLARLLALCREEEPLTAIVIIELTAAGLLAALNLDLIDAGFTMSGEKFDGLVREAVWSERPVVALPLQHPLLSWDEVPFVEIMRYPLILPHRERCAGGYELFRQALLAHGMPPPDVAEYICGHELMLVAAGYGVGFGLESQAALYSHPDIVIRPVTDELASASTYIVTGDMPKLESFIERARQIGGLARPEGDGPAWPAS